MIQVTSDIHKLYISMFQALCIALTVGMSCRCLFGPLSYSFIFIVIESMKIFGHIGVAIFNVSAILQCLFIVDINWSQKYSDQRILGISICAAFSVGIGIGIFEYSLVCTNFIINIISSCQVN